MDEKSEFVEPFKPSALHAVYRWIDRLPGPYWLFSVAFVVITGLLNLVVAWTAHILPFGQVNWDYALTGMFFAYYFLAINLLLRAARNAASEFLTTLDVDESKSRLILFEFTHLPALPVGVFFVLGAILGLGFGIYLFPTAPEMDHAFPTLEIPMYSLSMGTGFILLYMILRATRLIGRLFRERLIIDIFDQTALHAISRYSAWLVIVIAINTFLQFLLIPSFVDISASFLALNAFDWLIVLFVFWLPLRGVNRTLVSEKRRLLKDVNLRLKTNFDLLGSKVDSHEYENMGSLQAMISSLHLQQESIKSISTWPWQPSTLTALLTAAVLPVLTSLLVEVINRFISH